MIFLRGSCRHLRQMQDSYNGRDLFLAVGALLDYEATKEGLDNCSIRALGLDVQWHEPFDPAEDLARHQRY